MEYFTTEKKRYITRGIQSDIPLLYQMVMFAAINELKVSEIDIDYLQIFQLSVQSIEGEDVQIINHRQEEPEYSEKLEMPIQDKGINEKVYVIDDGADYITMLLASEY